MTKTIDRFRIIFIIPLFGGLKRIISVILLGLAITVSVQAANNFSSDANCVSLWRFENGALTTDSKGTNTLTASGTPAADAVNYKEGAASCDFESTENDYFTIADGDLSASFPTTIWSICSWFRLESLPSSSSPDYSVRQIIARGYGASNYCWRVEAFLNGTNTQATFFIGYDSGNSVERVILTNRNLSTGVWYHVLVSFNNTDKSYCIRLYDTVNTTWYSMTGKTINNINVEVADLWIGSTNLHFSEMDGLIDELLVFNDIVSPFEQDQIIAGTYNGPSTAVGGGTTMYMGNF